MKQLTLDEVVQVKERLQRDVPELKELSVPEFAEFAQQLSEKYDFSTGLNWSFPARISRLVDIPLRPVSRLGQKAGRWVDELLGTEDLFADVGKQTPRGILELLAFVYGGPYTKVLGLGSHATKEYEMTSSIPATAVGTLGFGLIPASARLGHAAAAKGVARLAGGKLGGIGERAAEILGREAGVLANQIATLQGQSFAQTGELATLEKEQWAKILAGQLPFTILDVPYVLRGRPGAPFRSSAEQELVTREVEKLTGKTPTAFVAPLKPPKDTKDTKSLALEKTSRGYSLPELDRLLGYLFRDNEAGELDTVIATKKLATDGSLTPTDTSRINPKFVEFLVKHDYAIPTPEGGLRVGKKTLEEELGNIMANKASDLAWKQYVRSKEKAIAQALGGDWLRRFKSHPILGDMEVLNSDVNRMQFVDLPNEAGVRMTFDGEALNVGISRDGKLIRLSDGQPAESVIAAMKQRADEARLKAWEAEKAEFMKYLQWKKEYEDKYGLLPDGVTPETYPDMIPWDEFKKQVTETLDPLKNVLDRHLQNVLKKLVVERSSTVEQIEAVLDPHFRVKLLARAVKDLLNELGKFKQFDENTVFRSNLKEFEDVDKQLAELARKMPAIEAAQKLAQSLVERLAILTKAAQEVADRKAANVRMYLGTKEGKKLFLEAKELEKGFDELAKQPWGQDAFKALAELIVDPTGFTVRGEYPVDAGMISDPAYWRLYSTLVELRKPEVWERVIADMRKADETFDPSNERDRVKAVRRFLYKRVGIEANRELSREVFRLRILESIEQALQIKELLEEVPTLDYRPEDVILLDKEQAASENSLARDFLNALRTGTFKMGWETEVVKEGGQVKLIRARPPDRRQRATWGNFLAAVANKVGGVELTFEAGQFKGLRVENPDAFLRYVRYEGTFENFMRTEFNRYILPRLQGEMHRFIISKSVANVIDPTSLDSLTNFYRLQGNSDADSRAFAKAALNVYKAFKKLPMFEVGTKDIEGLSAFVTFGEKGYILSLTPNFFRILENQPVYALQVLGHELGHLVDIHDVQTESFLRTSRRILHTMGPEDRYEMAKKFFMTFIPEQLHAEFGPTILGRAREAAEKPSELMADLLGMAAIGAASPMNKSAIERFMVDSSIYEAYFLRNATLPIQELFKGVLKLFEVDDIIHLSLGERGGLVTARDVYKRVTDNVSQMVQVADKALLVGEAFVVMADNDPNEVGKNITTVASKLFQNFLPKEQSEYWSTQVSWFWRTLAPTAQLSARFPKLAGVIKTAFDFHPISNSFAVKVIEPLLSVSKPRVPFGKQVEFDEKLTGLKYLLTHPNAERAASEVALAEQAMERLMTPVEITSFLKSKGYSEEVIDAVIRWESAATTIMTRMAEQIVRVHEELANLRVATVLMHENPGLDANTARNAAALVLQGQSPRGLNVKAAFDVASDMTSALNSLRNSLMGRPWFRTEMRIGRYMVAWKEPGTNTPGTFAAETRHEIDAYIEKLKKRGATNIVAWDKYDRRNTFAGLHPDFVQSMTVVEQSAYANRIAEIVKKHGLPDEVAQDLADSYIPLAAVTKELAESGFEKFMLPRKLSPGREDLNMIRGTLHYVQAMSKVLAKKLVSAQFALEMAAPELRGEDALRKVARDNFQAVVNPSGGEFTALKNLLFMYYLAFSPSQMVIEATQSLSTVAPQLTRDVGDPLVGYRYLHDGLGLVLKKAKGEGFGSAELDAAFKRAVSEQVIDFGALQEIYDAEALARINLSAAMNNKPLADATYFAKSALQWTFRFARDVYAMMPRLNSMMTFLAAYKMAREHGVLVGGKLKKLGPEEAYQYAAMTNRRTLFGGGVAARPVGLFANKGNVQGVIGLMYSLASFTMSSIAMYARLASDSLSRLPAPEKAAARKALAQMLLTQGALAGLFGPPLASAFVAVVDALFPEQEIALNIEEKTREAFAALLGDQAADFLADMALRGLPAAVLGVDLSSRLELSHIMGVNPYDGFNLQAFFGPGASMVGNMIKAMTEFGRGEVGQGFTSLVPFPLKNAVRLLSGGGVVRDRAWRPVLEDMTGAEKALYVLGFKPTRLSKAQLVTRLAERHEKVTGDKLARFHRELAKILTIDGRPDIVLQKVWEKYEETEGLYDPIAGLRSVAEKGAAMMVQHDPSRLGTILSRPTRRGLMELTGVITPDPVARLLKQKELEALLGLPARISRRSIDALWR